MRPLALLTAAMAFAGPAQAAELFGGVFAHAVNTPLSLQSGREGGADLQLGIRGGRIGRTPLQPYLFGSLNTSGETSFAAVGLSARFGNKLYVRPGIGLAIHNGSAEKFSLRDELALGSRILFEPELGVGYQINDRASVEASLVHVSQGQLFSGQNPGMDNVGVRLNWKL